MRSQVRDIPFQQKQNGHPFRDDRLFLVDDTRLEPAGAGAQRPASAALSARKARSNCEPFGSDFMVDDTRLELVTSRTSSGCATSCANRPSLCQLGHFTLSLCACQAFFHQIPRFARMRGCTSVDIILENGGHNYQSHLIAAKNCNRFVPNYSVFW